MTAESDKAERMFTRRLLPVLTLIILSGAVGVAHAQESTGFHLPLPHIDLTRIGIGAKPGIFKGSLDKTVRAGTPAQLWADTSLGPDCTPKGDTVLEVVTPGAHGATDIRPGELYAVYPEGHKLAYCSGRLVTGVLAIYKAENGYTGADQVVLRGVTADGETRIVTVDITVLPRPVGATLGFKPPPVQTAPTRPSAPTPLEPVPPPTIRDSKAPAPEVLHTPFPNG
jgi:hypothetical protein